MRRALLCLVIAAAAAGCNRVAAPRGPEAPQSEGILRLDDLRTAGQARSVALAFLRAYARSPADGARALDAVVIGPLAKQWVHWVAIQNASFPGTITGSLRLGDLGPPLLVRAENGSLDDVLAYGIVVRATVTFEVTDENGRTGRVPRVMDGLIVVVQSPDGLFRVLNFERDGRRLDEFFRVFDGAEEQRGGVTVEIRNLVQLERWQFGVRIVNQTREPLRVLPNDSALLTSDRVPATEEPPIVTFPRPIEPGRSAEGIVSFTTPGATGPLDLQIAVAGPDGKATGFVFAVPQPTTGSATPSPSPSV
jgi:hypothetical protein